MPVLLQTNNYPIDEASQRINQEGQHCRRERHGAASKGRVFAKTVPLQASEGCIARLKRGIRGETRLFRQKMYAFHRDFHPPSAKVTNKREHEPELWGRSKRQMSSISFTSPFGKQASPVLRRPSLEPSRSPNALTSPALLDSLDSDPIRRRSVDVPLLHKPPPRRPRTGSRSAIERRLTHSVGCESLFAQYLTSVLNYSLSLATNTEHADSPTSLMEVDSQSSQDQYIPVPENIALPHAHLDSPRNNKTRPAQVIPSTISPERRNFLIDHLSKWDFDPHDLTADELCECNSIVFECYLQVPEIAEQIDIDRIRNLIFALRGAYRALNAYHNFTHATDVMQATYAFVVQMGLAPPLSSLKSSQRSTWSRSTALNAPGQIGELLRPLDVLALLFAAIGHDVGHPGLSNAYMVNARTPLAQVYDDRSVLENFHSVTLLQMMKQYGFGHLLESPCNTPNPSSCGSSTEFKRLLLSTVFATDMSKHFNFVGKIVDLGRRKSATSWPKNPEAEIPEMGYATPSTSPTKPSAPPSLEEDRALVCAGLMKCADISNPTRPHAIAKRWSTALLEEWAVQAQIEERLQLPISVVIFNPEERRAQAKSQVGFINLFTQPLFDALATVTPAFNVFADNCRRGREIWEERLVSDEPSPDSATVTALPSSNVTYVKSTCLEVQDAIETATGEPSSSRRNSKTVPLIRSPLARSSPGLASKRNSINIDAIDTRAANLASPSDTNHTGSSMDTDKSMSSRKSSLPTPTCRCQNIHDAFCSNAPSRQLSEQGRQTKGLPSRPPSDSRFKKPSLLDISNSNDWLPEAFMPAVSATVLR